MDGHQGSSGAHSGGRRRVRRRHRSPAARGRGIGRPARAQLIGWVRSFKLCDRYDYDVTTVSSPAAQIGTIVRAPKTGELIATRLRRQIVRGELKPGETLPAEGQLMEQYGVSRPTLREAFRILEAETLISVRRGSRGGARVVAPDASVAARYVGLLLQIQGATINDVYEARMISEPPCARLLALHRTDEDLEKLT